MKVGMEIRTGHKARSNLARVEGGVGWGVNAPLNAPQHCTLSACTVCPGSACWWRAVHCCRWPPWGAVQFYQPIRDTVQTEVSGVVSNLCV